MKPKRFKLTKEQIGKRILPLALVPLMTLSLNGCATESETKEPEETSLISTLTPEVSLKEADDAIILTYMRYANDQIQNTAVPHSTYSYIHDEFLIPAISEYYKYVELAELQLSPEYIGEDVKENHSRFVSKAEEFEEEVVAKYGESYSFANSPYVYAITIDTETINRDEVPIYLPTNNQFEGRVPDGAVIVDGIVYIPSSYAPQPTPGK